MIRFLRLPEVIELTGLSRSTIYAMVERNEMPAPAKLGPRAIAWPDSEIRNWIDDRLAERENA